VYHCAVTGVVRYPAATCHTSTTKRLSGTPPCRCIHTNKETIHALYRPPRRPGRPSHHRHRNDHHQLTAIAAAAPDPIFAAIERCRSRWAAANAPDRREDDDLPSFALDEADRQFVQSVPTTVAGLLAFIAYHRSRDNGDDIGRKWTDASLSGRIMKKADWVGRRFMGTIETFHLASGGSG